MTTSDAPNRMSQLELELFLRQFSSHCSTFVETGTYYGMTTWALSGDFEKLYTIEADALLSKRARHVFRSTNVEELEGDSAEILRRLVPRLKSPALFFLDAHISGGATYYRGVSGRGRVACPVIEEVTAIVDSELASEHCVVVDDARLLGTPGWPSMEEVVTAVRGVYPIDECRDTLVLANVPFEADGDVLVKLFESVGIGTMRSERELGQRINE